MKPNIPQARQAFNLLFFVELWERFGYYGMQALLILYMTHVYHFTDAKAYSIFGAFSALLFATLMIGGYLGDRWMGYQRTLIVGAALLLLGYLCLTTLHPRLFYWGLSLIIIGNGFFKTSPAALLGRLYGANHPHLEKQFTFFYMSINIGALIAMLLSGFISQSLGWHYGFGLSAAGLFMGLSSFLIFRTALKNIGSLADQTPLRLPFLLLLVCGITASCYFLNILLQHLTFTYLVLTSIILMTLIYFTFLLTTVQNIERQRMIACFVLILLSIGFFALYFQMPMTINLFVDRNVSHQLFSITIPTASFQAFYPLWIICLAPLLARVYQFLEQKQLKPGIPLRFAIGIILMGCGFTLLATSRFFANTNGIVSPSWLIASIGIQTLAELLVFALGLAMVAKLSPQKYLGFMMGMFYLATSMAGLIGGQIAKLSSISTENPIQTTASLLIYSRAFLEYGLAAIFVGLLAFLLVPYLNRRMHEGINA